MKTILVPTDFSETAANAMNYAVELALFTKSKLLLFHAYHIPMIVTEVPFVLTSEDIQLEEESKEQMRLLADGLQKKYENLEIENLSLLGFASDEIVDIAKDKNCDLIIMGTKGAPTGINKFLGSNTIDVIKHTECHVLVIPDKIKFRKIDKIVFAFDYNIINNKSVLNPLIELAYLFNSEILIFNMEDSRIHPTLDKESGGIKLDNIFEKLKHTYWFSEHENLVDAINEFADDNHAVMITMIRRSHSLFQQILTKSNTKLMALNPHLPLLILHEQTER